MKTTNSLLDELISLQKQDPEQARRRFETLAPDEVAALALENYRRAEAFDEQPTMVHSIE